MMNGIIHAYSAAVSAGLINGTDGNRYSFSSIEWEGTSAPVHNQKVTFKSEGGRAVKVGV